MRQLFVKLHRYVGLLMAGFLVLVGITGSLLAFYHELDAAFAPALHHASPPYENAQPIDPLALREQVARAYPELRAYYVPLYIEAGKTVSFFLEPPIDETDANEPVVDEVFVNPYTGDVTGDRLWGDIQEGLHNLMPFVYRLHYALAIPGQVGAIVLGIVALIWTLDCFTGVLLTFPPARARKPRRSLAQWWRQWQPAWKIRWRSTRHKVTFDLHRAGSLWLWVMLFIFAWSSVGFNLPEQVFRPVMSTLFDYEDAAASLPKPAAPQPEPGMSWKAALQNARTLMAQEGKRYGFAIIEEDYMSYDPARVAFRYRVRSDGDLGERYGGTSLWFDANQGHKLVFQTATGMHTGNTVATWLFHLHMGTVFGLPYRIFVCVFGVLVAGVSVTGALIWLRKHGARRVRGQKRQVSLPNLQENDSPL